MLCANDHDCRIQAAGRRQAYFPERGSSRCTWSSGWHACLYTHTTRLHYQRAVWVRERDGLVRELPLPTTGLQQVTGLRNTGPGLRVEVDGVEGEGLVRPPSL